MKTLEFRPTPTRGEWLLCCIPALGAVAALVGVTAGPGWSHFLEHSVSNGHISRGYGFAWVGLFMAVLVPTAVLRTRLSYTRLTPKGIEGRALIRHTFIPWSDVTDIAPTSVGLTIHVRRVRVDRRNAEHIYLAGMQDNAIRDGVFEPSKQVIAYWKSITEPSEAARRP
ncbi:PH domain-containing protein [Embleya sp. AB8]|uniref:PH domain-containing protein n=1 Tax=Embleya sp. AB8 TaxID=3156304 RepID=UPI003C714007